MTLCQWGKKGGDVDNFIGIFLVLSECQGTRYDGDNPLPHFRGLHTLTLSPTFYHRFVYTDSVKTTFSPL